MIHVIVAIDENRGIGYGGDMLYHIREDLRRFKALTMGHTLIMGRKPSTRCRTALCRVAEI